MESKQRVPAAMRKNWVIGGGQCADTGWSSESSDTEEKFNRSQLSTVFVSANIVANRKGFIRREFKEKLESALQAFHKEYGDKPFHELIAHLSDPSKLSAISLPLIDAEAISATDYVRKFIAQHPQNKPSRSDAEQEWPNLYGDDECSDHEVGQVPSWFFK